MKTAERMMIDWMESEIQQNGKLKLKAKQFYKIWNWFQSVELAEHARNTLVVSGIYDVSGSYPDRNYFPDQFIPTKGVHDDTSKTDGQ